MTYMVLHGRRSLQVATDRLVVPAQEVEAFSSAMHCAQAVTALLGGERQRVEAALAAAQRSGHAQGVRSGEAAASAAFAQAVAQMAHDRQVHQEAARDAVCTLALAVVRKLAASLGAHAVVPALLEQAVSAVVPDQALRVRVHPELVAVVQASLEQANLAAEVAGDEALDSFGCVIESAEGRSLVSLEAQLGVLGRALGATATKPLAAA